jgi:hypothetical protein
MIKLGEINCEEGSWIYLAWDHNLVAACIISVGRVA